MNANFSVTKYFQNSKFTPWSDEPKMNAFNRDFETFKEAAAYFIEEKQEWLHIKDEDDYLMKTWEKGDTLYFAVVHWGVVLFQMELYPIPEDCDDDLPW